ncbi:DUF6381 family protein [Streptomyces griseus]|uniref:DUF6381 family protein n=1 Tax=Streptomyces griseus TaxID=1911 RepID=UPI0008402767|nr:DUF6381 family protein [Streptomyces griseus]
MSDGGAQQMRDRAKDLENSAERTADPEERQRLTDEARRLRARSEQASGMASGDIYPCE